MQANAALFGPIGAVALGLALPFTLPTAASAAIRCDGDFQIVSGQPISTPYCRDQHLAIVAREYGIKTTPAAIRNNPNHKLDVCRIVGRDIRVDQACVEVLPDARFRR